MRIVAAAKAGQTVVATAAAVIPQFLMMVAAPFRNMLFLMIVAQSGLWAAVGVGVVGAAVAAVVAGVAVAAVATGAAVTVHEFLHLELWIRWHFLILLGRTVVLYFLGATD